MHYIIVYDVSDNNKRNIIREKLKDIGGERIQYSGFIIDMDEEELIQLLGRIRRILEGEKGRVIAIPLCEKDMKKLITLTHNYEIKDELL